MEQQEKGHAAKMRVLLDDATQRLTAIRKQNGRDEQDLKAAIDRALIERRSDDWMRSTRAMSPSPAQTDKSPRTAEAESNRVNAENKAKSEMVQLVEKVRADAEAAKTKATQDASSRKTRKDAHMDEAMAIAKAIEVDANVEEMAAAQLKEKRSFDVAGQRFQSQGLAQRDAW